MKSVRTYNMTKAAINILNSKPNKSKFVCRAVHKLHNAELEFSIADVPTKQLLVAYFNRLPIDDVLRPLLLQRINDMS